jgi:ribosome-binding protein aMBF1 (putative translation factor)
MAHTRFDDITAARTAKMTPAERARFDADARRLAAALRLGLAIRDAREAAGLTQTELAGRMGVAQSALSRIEAGRANITVEMLARIAGALGTSLSVHLGAAQADLASA